jgi:hypothetical protein
MTRFSICLVGAALAAAACGDDTASDGTGTGGNGGSASVSSSSSSSPASGSVVSTGTGAGSTASASVASTSQGSGGEGGSGEGGSGVVPPFRTAVDMADEPLAMRALQIVGADVPGAEGNCLPCHALTEGNLRNWEELTNGVLDDCLTDLEVSTPEVALEMIECVRDRTVEGADKFGATAVGFWAAGATREWWRYTFRLAYPEDGDERFARFVQQIKMPPNLNPSLDSADYDVVGEWFVRGAPLLHEILDEPDPDGCEPLVTDEIADYVADRQENGWRAHNASNGMLMFGCEGAEPAIDCLSSEPDAPAGWLVPGQGLLKRLASVDYDSSFWTRGSADGRFVAHGAWTGQLSAAIVDLQDDKVIPVNASYDPAFFPDDSGFMFQGSSGNTCAMDVLTEGPDQILMNEDGCSSVAEVGLYQHVGASLGGGDYFAVDGPFVSDDGGHGVTTENPAAFFDNNSDAWLIPMIFNGSEFEAEDRIRIDTPNDGDAVISPSAGLLLSRSNGPSGTNAGYRLRKLELSPDGGSFDVDATVVANYCISGGKPAFSYDERWIVIHHYVENTDEDAIELGFSGASDPGFATYRNNGAANIFLIDVTTGESHRITNMPSGSYALFPYFRSDGWIYFIVRTSQQNDGETIIASDAALRAEGI